MCLAAQGYGYARRRRNFHLGAHGTPQPTREGVRSRACSPARRLDGSRPQNRVRRTFLSGKSDDARDGTPAHARPHVRSSAQKALVRTSHTEKCLRSRCAGAAALVVSAITAGIARVVSLVTAAAAPPPVTAPLRAVTRPSAAFCACRHGAPAATPGRVLRALWTFFVWASRWVSLGGGRTGGKRVFAL